MEDEIYPHVKNHWSTVNLSLHGRNQVSRFGAKNTVLGGKIFVFIICLKQIFLSIKFGKQCPGDFGPGSRYKKVENHWSIEIISRIHTDQSKFGAERSASENKTQVKQICLRQYNVALSLIAASVLKICRTRPGCTMDRNHCSVVSVRKYL